MSAPFFIVGASCKLKINGVILAYATDLQYSVKIAHATPKVLGMYESYTQEPLSYSVSGSFSIIRYARGLKSAMEKKGYTAPDGISERGNGVGSWIPEGKKNKATLGQSVEVRADESLNPDGLYNPQGFTIEVIQKAAEGMEGIIAKIRNCRIISSDMRITKRGVAVQSFTFQACYLDEDTFEAHESGTGQTVLG